MSEVLHAGVTVTETDQSEHTVTCWCYCYRDRSKCYMLVLLLQRQIEVSEVMQGYMQVLLNLDMEPSAEVDCKMQLTMISEFLVLRIQHFTLLRGKFGSLRLGAATAPWTNSAA